jgi:protein involved in polysaccharide export with SLBB domain
MSILSLRLPQISGSLLGWIAGIVFLSGWMLAPAPADAQGFGRVEETNSNVAYFYHARPGQATVQISVWGTIPRPGIYEIPDTTDLDKLLTMAGGAPLQPRTEDRDPVKITVRVYRPQSAAQTEDSGTTEGTTAPRTMIFEAPLERMLAGKAQYPDLRDDDIVVVETVQPKEGFSFRDALSIASTLGTLTLLGLRLFDRAN